MFDQAMRSEPPAAGADPIGLDDRSMRAFELGLALLAIVGAILLTVAR